MRLRVWLIQTFNVLWGNIMTGISANELKNKRRFSNPNRVGTTNRSGSFCTWQRPFCSDESLTHYQYLRECELTAALVESNEDMAARTLC